MTRYTDPDTPDFARNYPSGGALIGPAWERGWTELGAGDVVPLDRLLEAMTKSIQPKTARNLLSGATRAGLLRAVRKRRKIVAYARR